MLMQIKKRDGRIVEFNQEKIARAIYKAAMAVGGHDYLTAKELSNDVLEYLIHILPENELPDVETIQDCVEKILIEKGHAKTAKSYILYRATRTKIRESQTRLMKTYHGITYAEAEENDLMRENANVDGNTAMGAMLKYGSEGAKEFYHLHVLNPEHSKAHQSGKIHIHDLDFLTLTMTCCQIDIIKLFKNGFSTGHGYLREPQDIFSYAALAAIAIQSNQNDMHGGQSIPNFDYGLAPGVSKTYIKLYKSNLGKALEFLLDLSPEEAKEIAIKSIEETIKETGLNPQLEMKSEYLDVELETIKKRFNIKDECIIRKAQDFASKHAAKEVDEKTFQAMEGFIHNLNTMHSRAGAQVPFSSINFGTDTSPEGRMVSKNFLLATERGLGNGETPIFPISIFKIKKGISFEKGDPNYDLFKLACRVSAKRLFPNFSFLDAPFNKIYYDKYGVEGEVAYMGCRTRVVANHYDPSKEITYGRGNLSFTSVNLPYIAITSKGNLDVFFEKLDETIDLVKMQLLERFEIQAKKKVKNFPFLMGQKIWIDSEKLDRNDEIREVIKHGTLTMGFIGLAEALKALIGKHHGESDEAQKLGLEIVGHMRKRMDEACKEYGLNFSLIASPAEGLSGRFTAIDKKRFGIIEGVTDREYYTNSFHIPVYYPISAFDKIRLEAPYHELCNGGHITYIELDGDPVKNLEAFETIVRAMAEAGVGYGSINHPVDRDPICGFSGILDNECPKCGRKDGENGVYFERIRRITGYLVGDLSRWNDGKRAEEKDRVKHSI
ncbi:anaerobic ribonucleoside triphosphate reductase [Defluviitalea saccharophila]|uniref:Anaerobic ribonucleoside triphosphate reductase n=2 Tax=Defluviitalea saccharophila TaxID=879970 RepID=A0ABZ2Y4C4_9FIRM